MTYVYTVFIHEINIHVLDITISQVNLIYFCDSQILY